MRTFSFPYISRAHLLVDSIRTVQSIALNQQTTKPNSMSWWKIYYTQMLLNFMLSIRMKTKQQHFWDNEIITFTNFEMMSIVNLIKATTKIILIICFTILPFFFPKNTTAQRMCTKKTTIFHFIEHLSQQLFMTFWLHCGIECCMFPIFFG